MNDEPAEGQRTKTKDEGGTLRDFLAWLILHPSSAVLPGGRIVGENENRPSWKWGAVTGVKQNGPGFSPGAAFSA